MKADRWVSSHPISASCDVSSGPASSPELSHTAALRLFPPLPDDSREAGVILSSCGQSEVPRLNLQVLNFFHLPSSEVEQGVMCELVSNLTV